MIALSPDELNRIFETIALVVASGLIFAGLARFLREIGRRAGFRKVTDRSIRDTVRVIWLVAVGFGVLAIWSLTSQFSFLTASGIAGLVLSLALQTTLSNMISGIYLLRDQLVRVGDEIEYGSVRGRIIRVALRNTWIRTADGSVAVIGNSSLAAGPIINHTGSNRFTEYYDGGPEAPVPPTGGWISARPPAPPAR